MTNKNGTLASRPEPAPSCPLTDLPVGSWAILERCELAHSDRAYLSALGLSDRCQLRICKQGEPCIVAVDNTRLGISLPIARQLHVSYAAADLSPSTSPLEATPSPVPVAETEAAPLATNS